MAVNDIFFEGLTAPVRTVDCEKTIERLAGYLPRWPFSIQPQTDTEHCVALAFNGAAWLIQSPHTPKHRIHKTEVNAICDLVSVLASAMIAQEPDLLCFHSAALEIDGGLVLFPAVRRSGKSTLAAVLMARGAKLFTDDYLPVKRNPEGIIVGRATGIAARLRIPVPETFPDYARAYLNAHPGPENRPYRFIAGPSVAPARRQLPIRSIVLLDRQDSGKANSSDVSESDLLGRLAYQNFSRGLMAGETLSLLIQLTQTAPAQHLTYSDPSEAADLILDGLPRIANTTPTPIKFPEPGPRPDAAHFSPNIRYKSTAFARLRKAGEVWVGASCNGLKLLKFDAAAVGVLDLLEDPITPEEVVHLIRDAFPDMDPAEIETNTFQILRNFLKVGFIARS